MGLLLGGAAAVPVLTGRTESPTFSLEAAKRAVQSARDSGAPRWAPDALLQAEASFRAAMTEHRRQELRFFFFRNFAASRAGLRLAEEKARATQAEAETTFKDAQEAAKAAIDEADETGARIESVGASMHLDYSRRRLLRRSQLALQEAHHLLRAGEPLRARERADASLRDAGEFQQAAVSLASRYTDPQRLNTWRRWAADTINWSRQTGGKAIVVVKEAHTMHLYDDGRRIATYRAEMGYNMLQGKLRSGDGATPEGRYRITAKKGAGQSTYYKALLLDYPNDEDRARFARERQAGSIPRGASPGSLIEIHGEGGRGKDWTRGCVALTNRDIDDLFARVPVGTPVTIVGSNGDGGMFTNLVRDHEAQGSGGGGSSR